MKYFGEYLVSKEIISYDDLLKALIEQTKSIPLPSEVCYEKGLLSSEEILRGITVQHEKGLDFKSACESIGLWKLDFETTIHAELQKVRVPLGQILVQRGKVDIATVTKNLDEFLSEIEGSPNEKSQIIDESIDIDSLQTTSSAEPINNDHIEELLSNLSYDKMDQLKNQINGIIMADSDISLQQEMLKSIIFEIHVIRGVLSAMNNNVFGELVINLENLFLGAHESLAAGKQIDVNKLMDTGSQSMDLLNEYISSVKATNDGNTWLLEDANKDKIAKINLSMSNI